MDDNTLVVLLRADTDQPAWKARLTQARDRIERDWDFGHNPFGIGCQVLDAKQRRLVAGALRHAAYDAHNGSDDAMPHQNYGYDTPQALEEALDHIADALDPEGAE